VSFWEANRGLVIGAAVALVVALGVDWLVAGPSRTNAVKLEAEAAELQSQIEALAPAAGQPAPQALETIGKERADLSKVLDKVKGLLLALPKDYQIPKNADNPRFNIFERKLAESRDRTNASGLFPRYDQSHPENCPLGFIPQVQKEDVPLLLERLYAADRLTEAVIESASHGPFRALGITHGPAGLLSSPGVTRMHLRLVPLTIRAAADEKTLMAFLERISREGSFLALQELHVEVTDTRAKTFNFTAEVRALVPRDGPGPRKTGGPGGPRRPVGPPPPIGRY